MGPERERALRKAEKGRKGKNKPKGPGNQEMVTPSARFLEKKEESRGRRVPTNVPVGPRGLRHYRPLKVPPRAKKKKLPVVPRT